jgi:hypothetical protein
MQGSRRRTTAWALALGAVLAAGCGTTSAEPTGGAAESPAEKEVVSDAASGTPDLVVFGAVETAVLHPSGLALEARIDSGATTSSIHAVDITEFERDGKPWVRFHIPVGEDAEPLEIESARVRTLKVKRHGAESVRRSVVQLDLAIGAVRRKSEFSLADRSGFEFPVLIGRSYLDGVATVDVSRQHAASENAE